jgi:protein-S-isoprenylcysteine O-methyltransferase Ste14
MTPKRERRILSAMLKRFEHPERVTTAARWLVVVIWLLLFCTYSVILLVAFDFLTFPGHSAAYAMAALVIMAMIAGYLGFYLAALRNWSFLRKHVSEDSLRSRLRELAP